MALMAVEPCSNDVYSMCLEGFVAWWGKITALIIATRVKRPIGVLVIWKIR
jgi:hypothetical protein